MDVGFDVVSLSLPVTRRRHSVWLQIRVCLTWLRYVCPQTPRHYVVTDTPGTARRQAEEQYSYSYSNETSSSRSDRPGALPTRSYTSSSERVSRSTGSGPGSYSSSTERVSRSSDYPGSYSHSYSSTSSGRLPGGTSYRHFSYRV